MPEADQKPRPLNGDLDTTVACPARVNNYWHGGKDNFARDREAAEQALEAFPELPVAVRAGVRFRAEVVTMLVAQKRTYRNQAEVTAFFDGPQRVPPGVVPVPRWRADSDTEARAPTMAWCGVGRKP